MKLTKKILLAFGLAAAAGASYAQTAPTGAAPVGVLGQSFSELSFGVQDIDNLSPNFYSLGVGANVPVAPHVDLGASYNYGWIRGNVHGHQNTIGATATAYTALSGVKPFVMAGLGYQWSSYRGFRDNGSLWALGAGVEIPVGAITLTPRIVYNDDFEASAASSQAATYEVEANYWVSRSTAVFGTVGRTDYLHSSTNSWNYQAGVRLKF